MPAISTPFARLPSSSGTHWHFEAAIEATPAGMVMVDARGHVVLANAHAERLFGYERQELIGWPVEALVPERFRALHPQHIAGYLATPLPRTMGAGRDLYGLRKDGSEVPIEIGLNPLDTPDGKFVLCSIVDISERKAAELELRSHRERLEELVQARTRELQVAMAAAEDANRAKSEFLANMSHELRTPMHAILAYARLGMDAKPALDLEQYLQRILDSGGRLLSLLNGLLDLSKLEAAKMVPEIDQHDVERIARTVAHDMQPLLESKSLELTFERAPDCDRCWLPVDDRLIHKVFYNILANAVRVSSDGQRINVRFADAELSDWRGRHRPALQIEYADEAIGIPADELERIFDKFVQSRKTRHGGGTGLGLAICKQIVDQHQGSLRAFNNARGGATFVVTLPREHDAERGRPSRTP